MFAVLTSFGLGACGATSEDRDGDPGVVVDRDHEVKGKINDYDLTIKRDSDGTVYEKDVSHPAYDHCYRGSKYPLCVDR